MIFPFNRWIGSDQSTTNRRYPTRPVSFSYRIRPVAAQIKAHWSLNCNTKINTSANIPNFGIEMALSVGIMNVVSGGCPACSSIA
jgi:hypothetical protein